LGIVALAWFGFVCLFVCFAFKIISLCSPVWPQTFDPPASASQVLELQMCITMPGFLGEFLNKLFFT
jgi:hypothetical protein